MDSWKRAGKFRDGLSQITVTPPPDAPPVEKSQFSPDSPPPPPRGFTSHFRMASSSSTTQLHRTPRSLEAGNRQSTDERPTIRERIAFMLHRFHLWRSEPEIVPIQQPRLAPWPPLHVEKRACPCEDPKRKKRRRLAAIFLIIILLYLLSNTIALNVRLFGTSTNGSNSSSSTSSSGNSHQFQLSADQQQCVSQFSVDAPSNPSSFP